MPLASLRGFLAGRVSSSSSFSSDDEASSADSTGAGAGAGALGLPFPFAEAGVLLLLLLPAVERRLQALKAEVSREVSQSLRREGEGKSCLGAPLLTGTAVSSSSDASSSVLTFFPAARVLPDAGTASSRLEGQPLGRRRQGRAEAKAAAMEARTSCSRGHGRCLALRALVAGCRSRGRLLTTWLDLRACRWKQRGKRIRLRKRAKRRRARAGC